MANFLVKHNPLYNYSSLKRKEGPNGRQYLTPDGNSVASVTTILDKTKPEEKRLALQNWRKRVGEERAKTITTEAAGRGTSMHKQLENWLATGELKTGSNLVHQQPSLMANTIIDNYLKPKLNEWWGSEASLYYTGLYAGTTDLPAVYNGKASIVDFKQTNKPKKVEWIEDYFLQLSAYILAHDHIFGTDIEQGVVLMCSKDLQPQEFIIDKIELAKYKDLWWTRVEQYYKQK